MSRPCAAVTGSGLGSGATSFQPGRTGIEPPVSVLERSLHFGPRTSVTTPLRFKRPRIRSLMLLQLQICRQPRPWECGNTEGISKECGKGEKPASWLSMLSILCHFHGLLWKRVLQSHDHREGAFRNRNHLSEMPTIQPELGSWMGPLTGYRRATMNLPRTRYSGNRNPTLFSRHIQLIDASALLSIEML